MQNPNSFTFSLVFKRWLHPNQDGLRSEGFVHGKTIFKILFGRAVLFFQLLLLKWNFYLDKIIVEWWTKTDACNSYKVFAQINYALIIIKIVITINISSVLTSPVFAWKESLLWEQISIHTSCFQFSLKVTKGEPKKMQITDTKGNKKPFIHVALFCFSLKNVFE